MMLRMLRVGGLVRLETKNTKKSGNSKIAAIVLVRPQGCYWI